MSEGSNLSFEDIFSSHWSRSRLRTRNRSNLRSIGDVSFGLASHVLWWLLILCLLPSFHCDSVTAQLQWFLFSSLLAVRNRQNQLYYKIYNQWLWDEKATDEEEEEARELDETDTDDDDEKELEEEDRPGDRGEVDVFEAASALRRGAACNSSHVCFISSLIPLLAKSKAVLWSCFVSDEQCKGKRRKWRVTNNARIRNSERMSLRVRMGEREEERDLVASAFSSFSSSITLERRSTLSNFLIMFCSPATASRLCSLLPSGNLRLHFDISS